MNYSPEEFLLLIEAVEEAGGEHRIDNCKPTPIRYRRQAKSGGTTTFIFNTTGCGHAAKFDIPYSVDDQVVIPLDKDPETGVLVGKNGDLNLEHFGADNVQPDEAALQIDRGAGTVIACAVDDAVGAWPRFQGALA